MNQYIPQLEELDLKTEQLSNEWKGVNHHIGPVQQSTSLLTMLQGKTTCATATVISGVLLWGAKRLQPFVNEEPLNNVNFLNEMAEALFAWQHDTLYLDTNQLPDCGYNSMPDFPVENSASLSLLNFPAKSIDDY